MTIDRGYIFYGGHEALITFDRVLVLWERVFMHKELDFTTWLVENFFAHHR